MSPSFRRTRPAYLSLLSTAPHSLHFTFHFLLLTSLHSTYGICLFRLESDSKSRGQMPFQVSQIINGHQNLIFDQQNLSTSDLRLRICRAQDNNIEFLDRVKHKDDDLGGLSEHLPSRYTDCYFLTFCQKSRRISGSF